MKEEYEWIHSWSDKTNEKNFPRVLLIGDSIVYGYQEFVRELLRGRCYVDYISTSYSVDTPIYNDLIKLYARDNDYDIICYNHGLHGIQMSGAEFAVGVEKTLSTIEKVQPKAKIILVNVTEVKEPGNSARHKEWGPKVDERNDELQKIAEKRNYPIIDLFSLSKALPNEQRKEDGTHYLENGSRTLASLIVSDVCKINNL